MVINILHNRENTEMARRLAVGTVSAWFGNLSFEQQKDALDRMHGQHDKSLSAKRVELEGQLAALGYGAPKKRGRPAGKANGSGATMRKGRKGKVKAKY